MGKGRWGRKGKGNIPWLIVDFEKVEAGDGEIHFFPRIHHLFLVLGWMFLITDRDFHK